MQILDSFEPAVCRYEGVGHLVHAKITGKRRKRNRVSFEVKQLENGQIVLGWMASLWVNPDTVEKLLGVVGQPQASIEVDGLQTMDYELLGIGMSSGIAYASNMKLEKPQVYRPGVKSLDFSLVNLAFGRSAKSAAPLDIDTGDYSLHFSPSSDYEGIREKLGRLSGVAVTAICRCERLDKGDMDPSGVVKLMDEVCVALSLATGNKVTWVRWQTAPRPVMVAYRSSVTKPYGAEIVAYGRQLDFAEAVKGWVAATEKDYLRPMVDYFVDAVGPGPYLETRALAAASLLDALTNRYAEQGGFALLLDDDEWKKANPKVRKALREIDPSLESNIGALRRCPFKAKLSRLLDEQNLPSSHVNDVVEIRNMLVHSGRFLRGPRNVDQYFLLLNTAFAILARLTGYYREIPAAPTSPLAAGN